MFLDGREKVGGMKNWVKSAKSNERVEGRRGQYTEQLPLQKWDIKEWAGRPFFGRAAQKRGGPP